jgi:hypothetical protein
MDRRILQTVVTATLLFVAVLSSAAATGNGPTSQAIERDIVIAGRTYGEWSDCMVAVDAFDSSIFAPLV